MVGSRVGDLGSGGLGLLGGGLSGGVSTCHLTDQLPKRWRLH